MLSPVSEGASPNSKAEALSFALALRATRAIDDATPLQDAIYVERFSRLLPTYSISARTDDDVVLGYWLTGGAPISAKSFRRLRQTLSWLRAGHLKDVVQAAGIEVTEVIPADKRRTRPADASPIVQNKEASQSAQTSPAADKPATFELAGRPELANFFNEHIIDIIVHRDRYKALGIGFPSAIVLHRAVARHLPSSVWSTFSDGQVSRLTHPASLARTSTRLAKRWQRSLTRPCKVLHPYS